MLLAVCTFGCFAQQVVGCWFGSLPLAGAGNFKTPLGHINVAWNLHENCVGVVTSDIQCVLCLTQVAINWCICQDTIPIPGAKNLQQAEGNLGALGWRLTSGEQAALAEVADSVPRGMVQNIFQTK